MAVCIITCGQKKGRLQTTLSLYIWPDDIPTSAAVLNKNSNHCTLGHNVRVPAAGSRHALAFHDFQSRDMPKRDAKSAHWHPSPQMSIIPSPTSATRTQHRPPPSSHLQFLPSTPSTRHFASSAIPDSSRHHLANPSRKRYRTRTPSLCS